MNTDTCWTPAHQQALEQIHSIAKQYFDHSIIAVALQPDNMEDEGCVVYEWLGGRITAMGLVESFRNHLKDEQKHSTLEDDD